MQKSRVFVTALAVLACLLAARTSAYEVVFSAKSGTSVQNYLYTQGGCSHYDITLVNAMPTSSTYNDAAQQAYSSAGMTGNVPLGGIAKQAACFTSYCEWSWDQGLYYYGSLTFMRGTYSSSNPSTSAASVSDVYNNFATGYPKSWNYSYWGARVPAMTSDGTWINTDLSLIYDQYVCQGYTFEQSDAATYGYATYPNGDIIDPRSYITTSQRSHCGSMVEVDNSGRWVDVQCIKTFPWWAALIIAVSCFVVVVSLIILTMCCCLCNKNQKEAKAKVRQMAADEDNIARVPTQSQVGMSRDTVLAPQLGDLSGDDEDDVDGDGGRENSGYGSGVGF
ncbi:hypothetical protein STCU_05925 [Strigomonas culicis]|uniref:C-type lectin domain-containing protein n=1 Tax=Strigomonas culicis TaxID=28005 RepID=S9U8Q3_9TRYP|nr:hypothetical protein STCU_05925 [Strigomonas culicis]|eukprot:EPY27092.1 hypothetical protein STCU_05925 [Strigomonas culicis]